LRIRDADPLFAISLRDLYSASSSSSALRSNRRRVLEERQNSIFPALEVNRKRQKIVGLSD
jgi:hypothetical protein